MPENTFSRTAAVLVLAGIFPVLMICAMAIFLEDGGPVLFRQRRSGKHGRPFLLVKLRSMKVKSTGGSITAAGDSRVTGVGKVLREFKFDELPQLWNVVRGEMNFVGPRPEVPEYVTLSDPKWQAVLAVRPGITDLASLVFRHEQNLLAQHPDPAKFYREWLLPRKLELSAHYIRTRTMSSDAKLIALTLKHSLMPGEFDRQQVASQFSYRGGL